MMHQPKCNHQVPFALLENYTLTSAKFQKVRANTFSGRFPGGQVIPLKYNTGIKLHEEEEYYNYSILLFFLHPMRARRCLLILSDV